MKEQKKGIEFHPRRLSHSKSREKYSPYRKTSPQPKFRESEENREKLILQEPIIKIKSLIEGTSSKARLRLDNDLQFNQSNTSTTQFSNFFNNNYSQREQNEAISQLASKIDSQTEYMKQNFKQISLQLKLPRISQKQQLKSQREKLIKYQQNQKKMVSYLESLHQVTTENGCLKDELQTKKQQLQKMQAQLQQRDVQCLHLLQEISTMKLAGLLHLDEPSKISKQEIFSQKSVDQKQREVDFLESFEEDKNILNNFQNEDVRWQQILLKKQEQISSLKLQNQIYVEEIKLLNYTIQEKQAKISELSSKINSSKRKTSNQMTKTIFLQVQKEAILSSSESENVGSTDKFLKSKKEKDDNWNQIQKQSIRTKKTSSFIMANDQTNKIFLKIHKDLEQEMKERKPSRRYTSNDQLSLNGHHHYTSRNSMDPNNSLSMEIRKQTSDIDKKKMQQGISILKLKAKGSMNLNTSKHRSSKKEVKLFDSVTVAALELLRKTLGYKLKGLRLSFSSVECELLNRESCMISKQQIRKYLSDYPFLLSDFFISTVISYAFKKYSTDREQLKVQQFSKIMRQIVPSYQLSEEESEAIAICQIKNLIFGSEQDLCVELNQRQKQPGIIGSEELKVVLKDFKLGQAEIELIISQCCIISTDCDNLNYQQYFSLFKENQQEPI